MISKLMLSSMISLLIPMLAKTRINAKPLISQPFLELILTKLHLMSQHSAEPLLPKKSDNKSNK
jgi:hypothetical protein